jgi:phosphopantetheinyl transferase
VDLYIASIPDGEMGKVFPPRRQAQLEETGNETHRRQRYFVWKLLEYGLRRSLDLDLEQLALSLDDRGRWSCEECFFSLSHTKGAVAVAVSQAPVGVDVERLDRKLHPSLPKKLLTEAEQGAFASLDGAEQSRYLLAKWCKKESLFKWQEAAACEPKEEACAGTVTVAGQAYCWAAATEHPTQLRIYTLEDAQWN